MIYFEKLISNKWEIHDNSTGAMVWHVCNIKFQSEWKNSKKIHRYTDTAAYNFLSSISDPMRSLWYARRYVVRFLLGEFDFHSYRLRLLLLMSSLPQLIVSFFFVVFGCLFASFHSIPFHSNFITNKWKIIVDCLCCALCFTVVRITSKQHTHHTHEYKFCVCIFFAFSLSTLSFLMLWFQSTGLFKSTIYVCMHGICQLGERFFSHCSLHCIALLCFASDSQYNFTRARP